MSNIKELLNKLPEKPGVYLMKDKGGTIIYVGKASVLKNRVNQYFKSKTGQPLRTQIMVSKIDRFDYIITDSEVEALILECNLIKKYKPKFNVLLKDDKQYPYIKVTINEQYPRVLMVRRVQRDGAKYFGPYPNVSAVKGTLKILKQLFPVRTCSKNFSKLTKNVRPCLNFYIKRCSAPCTSEISMSDYDFLIRDVCIFLNGNHREIIKRLEHQMRQASANLNYELAANLRDKITNLKYISEKQKIISTSIKNQDIIAFARNSEKSCIQVFFIRGGIMIGAENFIMEGEDTATNQDLSTSFIKQFYSTVQYFPDEIILQLDIDDKETIAEWLSNEAEKKVYIKVPQRGEKLALINMAYKNAIIALSKLESTEENKNDTIDPIISDLANLLRLKSPIVRIEAYDISNTGNSEIVASMVVFEGTKPCKKHYRRFKIKTVQSQNDYACMEEVIYRRFRRIMQELGKEDLKDKEKESKELVRTDDSFKNVPDIIFVDGGSSHVSVTKAVLKELRIDIPVFGMLKDKKHMTRAIVSNDEEFDISDNFKLFKFIAFVQSEAHRYAIDYNKNLRKKRYTDSVLDTIAGIGSARKRELIKHFGSIDKIKSATINELLAVKGITEKMAKKVYLIFHH